MLDQHAQLLCTPPHSHSWPLWRRQRGWAGASALALAKPQDEVTRGRKQGQVLFGSLTIACAFFRAMLPHSVVPPGTAGLSWKRHIGPTFCHGTKAFQDREAVVACQRAGDPLKVITCLVLPTAGRNPKLGFEGGQTPLKKRAPRRGFHNP